MDSIEASGLSPALRGTLTMVAAALNSVQGRWWIIAGAAAVLHGVDMLPVEDVDVLLAEEDARLVMAQLGLSNIAGGETPLFRSTRFARWEAPPLPVEFMAGFHYRMRHRWERVWPTSREEVKVDGQSLFIPAARELAILLRGFGREKDLMRAEALEKIGPGAQH